jgi:hypothetical protein
MLTPERGLRVVSQHWFLGTLMWPDPKHGGWWIRWDLNPHICWTDLAGLTPVDAIQPDKIVAG